MSAPDTEKARPPLSHVGPGVAGVLSQLAFLSLPLLPILGVFVALAAPLPLVHQTALGRPSIMAWGWVTVALGVLALALQEPWAAVLCAGYLLLAVWPAVAVEWWLRRDWPVGRWLAVATLAALAVGASLLVAFALPGSPAELLEAVLAPSIDEARRLTGVLGSRSSDGEDMIVTTFRLLAYLTPALVCFSSENHLPLFLLQPVSPFQPN